MATPTSAPSTQRPDLAESFEEYDLEMNMRNLIGLEILTPIPVGQQSGNFGIIPVEQLLVIRDTSRAPGGGYARDQWKFTPSSYATEENGKEEPIDDRERAMYANYYSADTVATNRAMSAVLINCEIRISALIHGGGITSSAAAGAGVWSGANSTPIDDIKAAKQRVWTNCGMWPNFLQITEHMRQDLINNAQIIDRIKYSGLDDPKPGAITLAALAAALDIPTVLVGNAAKNVAITPDTASFANIWHATQACVGIRDTSRDFRQPCIGRTFHWGGDGAELMGTVEQYREESVRSDIFRVRHDTQEKILYAACGTLITGVHS